MRLFQSTIWTLIERAGTGDETALRRFVESYRPALVAYFRIRGFRRDCEDLTQEVLLRLFQDGVLRRVDPARGHFRSLLRSVADHVAGHFLARGRARKRGSGRHVPLDDCDLPVSPADDPEFDREWIGHLLDRAFDRLRRDLPHYHAVAHANLREGKSSAEIRCASGLSATDVRNRLHRARRKLAEFVRASILEYCTTSREARGEIEYLSSYLLGRLLAPPPALSS